MRNSDATYKKVLRAWAKGWIDENVSDPAAFTKLCNLAYYDLMYGPCADGSYGSENPEDETSDWYQWPGFQTACEKIAAAVEDAPYNLYVDTDCETATVEEPSNSEECPSCEGTGEYTEEEGGETFDCDACEGTGCVEMYWESIWHVERNEILAALVGCKELVEYIRWGMPGASGIDWNV